MLFQPRHALLQRAHDNTSRVAATCYTLPYQTLILLFARIRYHYRCAMSSPPGHLYAAPVVDAVYFWPLRCLRHTAYAAADYFAADD